MNQIYVLVKKQLHVFGHKNYYDTYHLAIDNKKQFYPSFSTKESAEKFIKENNLIHTLSHPLKLQ